MTDIHTKLRAHFEPSAVSWRVGSTNADKTKGMALAYIDVRDVMDRLDAVVGPENWSDSYTETAKGTLLCTLSIRINGEWISKCDGAGATDVEAEKGQVSDALKRAAVKWGIGRYLYSLSSPWVPIEARGRSYAITDAGLAKLVDVLSKSMASDKAARMSTPKPDAPEPVRSVTPIKAETVMKETAERIEHSREATDQWLDQLRQFYQQVTRNSVPLAHVKADLAAWEKMRASFWSDITPKDQERVSQALSKVNSAIAAKGKAAA